VPFFFGAGFFAGVLAGVLAAAVPAAADGLTVVAEEAEAGLAAAADGNVSAVFVIFVAPAVPVAGAASTTGTTAVEGSVRGFVAVLVKNASNPSILLSNLIA
jgi:hypothetical protein